MDLMGFQATLEINQVTFNRILHNWDIGSFLYFSLLFKNKIMCRMLDQTALAGVCILLVLLIHLTAIRLILLLSQRCDEDDFNGNMHRFLIKNAVAFLVNKRQQWQEETKSLSQL